jgi:hypothetical protein
MNRVVAGARHDMQRSEAQPAAWEVGWIAGDKILLWYGALVFGELFLFRDPLNLVFRDLFT